MQVVHISVVLPVHSDALVNTPLNKLHTDKFSWQTVSTRSMETSMHTLSCPVQVGPTASLLHPHKAISTPAPAHMAFHVCMLIHSNSYSTYIYD